MGSALTYLADAAVTTVKTDKPHGLPSRELHVAAAAMQGWRRSMEDAHFIAYNEEMKVYLFGVFDGHGGSGVSRYCAKRLPELVFDNENFKSKNFDIALHEAFLDIDLECQEPEIQEILFRMHQESKHGASVEDLKKIEIHLSFETILDLFLGNPADPVNHPSDPFKVFSDHYTIPDPFGIVLPSPADLSGLMSVASEEEGTRKRKRRNATMRYGERPPVYTAEPRSPWGHIASRMRQLVVNSREGNPLNARDPVFAELRELIEMIDASTDLELTLLRLKKEIDWSNIEAISEDPMSVFFDGILASLYHLTASCAVPWVYSIHPIDLLAVLNNNHIAGEGVNQRRCVSDDQGCTANVCLLSLNDTPILYCANAGDSRSILVRNSHAVPLSIDHKPSLPGERRRVLHAGGKVLGKMDPRVQGDLNLSRAIGDWRHKQNDSLPLELQMISPRPDITITNLTKEDEYIVLGCDGVWERFSSSDMANFVAALGAQGGEASVSPRRKSFLRHSLGSDEVAGNRSAAAIASAICAATIRKPHEFPGLPIGVTIGCDNMSVIVVKLESGIREKASENAPGESTDHHKLTLPVISYGAQVPDDWKPATPKSSPTGQRKSSGKKSASSSHHI